MARVTTSSFWRTVRTFWTARPLTVSSRCDTGAALGAVFAAFVAGGCVDSTSCASGAAMAVCVCSVERTEAKERRNRSGMIFARLLRCCLRRE